MYYMYVYCVDAAGSVVNGVEKLDLGGDKLLPATAGQYPPPALARLPVNVASSSIRRSGWLNQLL